MGRKKNTLEKLHWKKVFKYIVLIIIGEGYTDVAGEQNISLGIRMLLL